MAIHSSVLAWRTLWSRGVWRATSARVGHDLATKPNNQIKFHELWGWWTHRCTGRVVV